MGTGEEATGEPIKLGGIATNIPGVDFTWIPQMAGLYFDCVNANGGIDGRPIEYSYEDSSPDPALLASLATKLVEDDQVLGIVGNTDLLECDINGQYYEEQRVPPDHRRRRTGMLHQSPVVRGQHGPVLLEPRRGPGRGAGGSSRARCASFRPNQPGMDFNNTSVTDFAADQGLESKPFLEDVPIADPAGLAQRLVQECGEGSGVVLNFTGPTVVPLLQAIDEQGLIDCGDLGELHAAERSERRRGAERGRGTASSSSTPSSTCSTRACPTTT